MAYNTSTLVSPPSSAARPPLHAISFRDFTWLFTTVAVVASLLVVEQVVWRYKKGVLPGDAWTIPVIGKFKDSMSPSMEGYKKQWGLGDLSALSVFNMFVPFVLSVVHLNLTNLSQSFIVIASSNEVSRKILNSPTYAEPCLVHSAKQILCSDNWYGYLNA